MTEREEPRLPEAAEALLGDWPIAAGEDQAWEARAQRVAARLSDVAIGSTPDALLAAPFPEHSGEGASSGSAQLPTDPVDEPSFAEMARAVIKKKAEDSNAIARESLSLANAARRSAPEIVERVRRASVPPAAPEMEAVPARDVPAERLSRPAPASRPLTWMPAAVGAVALAAAVVLWLEGRLSPQSPNHAPLAQATVAAPASAGSELPMPAQPNATSGLPAELAQQPAGGDKAAPAKSHPPVPVQAAAEAAKSAPRIVLEEQSSPTAPAPTVPASSAQLRPADGTGNQVPDAPSSGAIQAALARPKAAAGHCVVGMPGDTTATVVFGSDGKVHSVSVSGPAQGTAAEGCIQSALSQAKVQPFARDTFQVRIAVRP